MILPDGYTLCCVEISPGLVAVSYENRRRIDLYEEGQKVRSIPLNDSSTFAIEPVPNFTQEMSRAT